MSIPDWSDPEAVRRWRKVHEYQRFKESGARRPKNKLSAARYQRERAARDQDFRLRRALRVRVHDILKGRQKAGSAVRDLGCTWEEFKKYLESLFQPGMSWDNWGRHGWHIDHRKPLSSFDLTDPVQFREAVHFTNLQPLWAMDNWIKSGKLPNI